MSEAALAELPEIPTQIGDLLGQAQQRIQENRRRPVANRFFFGANPTVGGQPRLTRLAVRMQETRRKEIQFVVTTAITIDGFETTSKLHTLDRYKLFVDKQVPRIRTQQWVNEDNADAINDLTDLIVNNFGWRLLNRPANLNEERTTEDIMVLTPTESFDPDNPTHYGLPLDFEISGERDPERMDQSFDGDFVAVADSVVQRIENFIQMTPPEGATEQRLEEFKEMQMDRAQDLLQVLSAITGRYSDESEQMWAKNCTSGAFRLPRDPAAFEPGENVIDDFYQVNEEGVYEPIEKNFEEVRLYGNTQATDEEGRVVSSALQEAIAEQRRTNQARRQGGDIPDGDDQEFADDNDNPFIKIAQEMAD